MRNNKNKHKQAMMKNNYEQPKRLPNYYRNHLPTWPLNLLTYQPFNSLTF